jgi:hypothetical protein
MAASCMEIRNVLCEAGATVLAHLRIRDTPVSNLDSKTKYSH